MFPGFLWIPYLEKSFFMVLVSSAIIYPADSSVSINRKLASERFPIGVAQIYRTGDLSSSVPGTAFYEFGFSVFAYSESGESKYSVEVISGLELIFFEFADFFCFSIINNELVPDTIITGTSP